MWFPFLIHTAPFISISPAFTAPPRRLSVSVGLRKMGLTQERNTFTAPFSFDVIRNSIPSKWVFQISQQSLKMSRDPLLSCAPHAPLHRRSWGQACSYVPGDVQRDQPLAIGHCCDSRMSIFCFNKGPCQIFVLNLKCKRRFSSGNVSCIFALKSRICSNQ